MKSPALLVIAACFAASSARAQFPNFPAADRLLGAPSFTTVGTGAATASTMNSPSGLAVDPATGKLFVADSVNNRILRFANTAALASGASAEAVLGQPNFTTGVAGPAISGLNEPYQLRVDRSGRLWVSDYGNNRVLMYAGASSLPASGASPDLVLGQPDTTTITPGASATKMNGPDDVFIDAADNLWVADYGNRRVLKFANAPTLVTGAAATTVLGQPDFATATSGLSASKMGGPAGLAVDKAGRLWVADYDNHRMLRFDNAASLGNGAAANGVLGQPNFTTNATAATARGMNRPTTLVLDAAGTLYVADASNNRILIFKNPAAKVNGAAADRVIGQPNFTTVTAGTTDRKINFPYGLALDAAGHLWVGDFSNNRVLRFRSDGRAAPPVIQGRVPTTTSNATLPIRGRASDPSGIAQVRYRVGGGRFQRASGTKAWRFTARLRPRVNRIEIVAVDGADNTSPPRRLRVTRR